ncbi:Predicted transcriptional regulator [Methylobacterium sp. 190mf]|uniref:MucR family transcriptional regulator n=1 Tax=Methylobacterium sp. 190mf TaxID=1761798 RepID=UPI00089EF7E8|nr:MucR family transcriptional regulator [Methylobacterium sp. 190mf]SEG71376.1 Predicted transcriptional regulator [Methylobacterium sp. 190mf]
MSTDTNRGELNLPALAGEIVAAYISNNPVPAPELPKLVRDVHGALVGLISGSGAIPTPLDEVRKVTTTQIRESIQPDGIVSFIDGKSYKTLKRHLTAHGLDPHSYRARFGLPADYPLVATSYAERRSALARAIGLGRPGAMAENVDASRDVDGRRC